MKEEQLQVFINCALEYFVTVTGQGATMGVPYMKTEHLDLLDYTGLVGITGRQRGGVYLTATSDMARQLAGMILQSDQVDDEDILAAMGELANTVAGNVRTVFGPGFMISTPVVVKGRPQNFKFVLRPPTICIPVHWQKHQAVLVVGVD